MHRQKSLTSSDNKTSDHITTPPILSPGGDEGQTATTSTDLMPALHHQDMETSLTMASHTSDPSCQDQKSIVDLTDSTNVSNILHLARPDLGKFFSMIPVP